MESLTKKGDKEVIKHIAKEFLENRLGVETTTSNVHRMAAHIIQFEKWLEGQLEKKPVRGGGRRFKPVFSLGVKKQVRVC